MPAQRLFESISQPATAAGTAQFVFPTPPTDLVWRGTMTCTTAPGSAVFVAFVGGSQWCSWAGASIGGPVQALPGEQVIITAVGLTAGTTYVLQWIGRSDSLSETEPSYPDTNAAGGATGTTVTQPPGSPSSVVSLIGGALLATATTAMAGSATLLVAPGAGTEYLLRHVAFTLGSGATQVQIVGATTGFVYTQSFSSSAVLDNMAGQIVTEALNFVTTGGGGSVWLTYDNGVPSVPGGGGGGGGGGGTSVGGNAVYGDGSDGSVVFDGAATVLGLAPVANVYTLTRDIFLASSTINVGVTIKLATYRIFCQGQLTNNGTISDSGGNGASNASGVGTGGASAQNVHSPYEIAAAGTLYSANGGTASAAGAGGNGQSLSTFTFQLGGHGGNAGSGSGGAGGSAGANGTVPPATGDVGGMRWLGALMGVWPSVHAIVSIQAQTFVAGSSGGGGSGDGVNGAGGGGGGGGIVTIFARTFAGTGAIQARGGNGGNATIGNTGGGGGGGGGVVIVISNSVTLGLPNNSISGQTIDANGGAAGASHGTGTAAQAGTAGTVVLIPN
jgi:hypothetical protein